VIGQELTRSKASRPDEVTFKVPLNLLELLEFNNILQNMLEYAEHSVTTSIL